MALILNIDTALDEAVVSIAEDGAVLKFSVNKAEKDHAAWIHPAISGLIKKTGYVMQDLNGVGVSIGPGSYTGLRIGLATAKGMCYSLKIPLIAINTLEAMAFSAKTLEATDSPAHDLLFCPMIDARRMEVFTAVYDSELNEVVKPHALILNENSFEKILKRQKILFLGKGSLKFQKICQNGHAMFKKIALNPAALATLTYKNFIGSNFADLAYREPMYIKEFFTKENESIKGNDDFAR